VVALAEALDVPLATAWTHDIIASDHPLCAGRPGTIGTRAGNLIAQACDLLLVLGSRLNIRQVSYNWTAFARQAEIIWVDVDPQELRKPFIAAPERVIADLGSLVPALLAEARRTNDRPDARGAHAAWAQACRRTREALEPRREDYASTDAGINPYHFVMELFDAMAPDAIAVCGNASACIIPFQVGRLHLGRRMFSNSGSASMGYDLPAALGASVFDRERQVVAIAGDGSIMMNLQELQSMAASDANVVLVILENEGYLSIKQTQTNFFGREYGASPRSNLTFPDFVEIAAAFHLPVQELRLGMDWKAALRESMLRRGPHVVVARLDPGQEFEPRLKSRMVDGVIQTPDLDDMYPHLSETELAEARRLLWEPTGPRHAQGE
jgi:acetolactate synthase-1/2/3 large subunit